MACNPIVLCYACWGGGWGGTQDTVIGTKFMTSSSHFNCAELLMVIPYWVCQSSINKMILIHLWRFVQGQHLPSSLALATLTWPRTMIVRIREEWNHEKGRSIGQSYPRMGWYALSPSQSKVLHLLPLMRVQIITRLERFDTLSKCTLEGLVGVFCWNIC